MKTKYILLSGILLISQVAFSQLKVLSNGYVGVNNSTPYSALDVNGQLHLRGSGNTFRFLPNNPGTEIGSSTGLIYFWYSSIGYNNLVARVIHLTSDSTLKKNIQPLNKGLSAIKQFKSYSYNFKNDKSNKKDYGFLAQEIEKILPDLVDTAKGLKVLNYNGVLPFIVEAIKEQQTQIETLQSLVYFQEQDLIDYKKQLNSCCSSDKGKSKSQNSNLNESATEDISSESTAKLFDNNPNPFSQDTEIMLYIPDNSTNSRIIIHDLQGVEIKSYSINQKGQTSLVISASELNAGMYLYTLLVDNKIIDTKRMILSK